jgi:hypothetical protein
MGDKAVDNTTLFSKHLALNEYHQYTVIFNGN